MVKIQARSVNESTQFLEATDGLLQAATFEALAAELDCSVALLRQARRHPDSPSFRNPPGGWQITMRRLLEGRAKYLASLAARLKVREDD